MAHNFTHSFVSAMNYVDERYVIEELADLARSAPARRVSIQWLPERGYTWFSLTRRIRKSIRRYRRWLPKHMKAHRVPRAAVRELRTDVFINDRRQLCVESYVRDSAGREYTQRVYA